MDARFRASVKIDSDELDRITKENQDLKRQMTGTGFSAAYQIPFEDLKIEDQIGGGGFSVVHRGYWQGTPVAIKKWFDPDHTDQLMQEFRDEVLTLQQLRHPNVLQFLGACMKPPNLLMVTEHLPHSLHAVIYNPSIELDKKRVVALALDIARAFQYLHSRKPSIIHRDIKPGNFLVDRAWRVKVCDFGLASSTNAAAGTPAYMAPELLEGKSYNEKVDVYAFGVLLNEMLTRRMPYDGLSLQELRAKAQSGGRPDMSLTCPKALEDIIKACWDQDAVKRPSFAKLVDQLNTIKI